MTLTMELLEIHDDDGWHVTVQIGTQMLLLFVSSSPYPIEAGKTYPVRLDFSNLDEPEVSFRADGTAPEIVRTDNAFGYRVTGMLRDNALHIGNLAFEDEDTFAQYRGLEGKVLRLEVARLAVEFLKTATTS